MPEIITDLETAVVSPRQHEYYVQVVGEQRSSGVWEAWLEFVPRDAALDVLITPTETTQPTLEDVRRWSATLTSVYLQGAFMRATHVSRGQGVARRYDTMVDDRVAPFDPFEVLTLGNAALRGRLRALTRSELLAMIRRFDLNPAGKTLTALSDSQLVTFIVTAVEVQRGNRVLARESK